MAKTRGKAPAHLQGKGTQSKGTPRKPRSTRAMAEAGGTPSDKSVATRSSPRKGEQPVVPAEETAGSKQTEKEVTAGRNSSDSDDVNNEKGGAEDLVEIEEGGEEEADLRGRKCEGNKRVTFPNEAYVIQEEKACK